MTTYIMLGHWTDQGARSAVDSPRRLDAAKALLAGMGGEFKHFYLTLGVYDVIAIYEAPDDAVAARWNDVIVGLALVALSLPRGAVRERYGSWNRFVV